MKIFIVFITVIGISFSQNEREDVIRAVYDYIDGTANGNKSQIRDAFESSSALYTVGKDGNLLRRSSEKYISYFKEGKKNNRIGKLVYLDIVNNAATAIVEIVMGKRLFTDYILLLKIKGKWKIINKSYTFETTDYKGKVLFVLSNYSSYGKHKKRTGTHFGELVVLYDEFVKKGYDIEFISPLGEDIPVAYINLQNELQRKYFYDSKFNYKLKHTMRPDDINASDYKGMVYIGGSASVFDLPDNKAIIKLAKTIYEDHRGVLGAICHGVAGLVNVKLSSGKYLVDGKTVNSFTNKEENVSGNGKYLPFLVESKLRERGAIFKSSENWKEHVEVSDRIVTGQNPASCEKFVNEMVKEIEVN